MAKSLGRDCELLGVHCTRAAAAASAPSSHCLSLELGMIRPPLGEEGADRHACLRLGHRCVERKKTAK